MRAGELHYVELPDGSRFGFFGSVLEALRAGVRLTGELRFFILTVHAPNRG